jgi:hypothetical protein
MPRHAGGQAGATRLSKPNRDHHMYVRPQGQKRLFKWQIHVERLKKGNTYNDKKIKCLKFEGLFLRSRRYEWRNCEASPKYTFFSSMTRYCCVSCFPISCSRCLSSAHHRHDCSNSVGCVFCFRMGRCGPLSLSTKVPRPRSPAFFCFPCFMPKSHDLSLV